MAYCIYTEIIALTGTELSQSDIEAIIAEADREIDAVLAYNGLGSADTNGGIKSASIKLSIAGVITRGRLDGTKPSNLVLGDMTISDNRDAAIAQLREAAMKTVAQYVKLQKASNVDNWICLTNE